MLFVVLADRFLSDHPALHKVLLQCIGVSMEDSLKKLPFLNGVAEEKMSLLVSMFSFFALAEGKTLYKEGEFCVCATSLA